MTSTQNKDTSNFLKPNNPFEKDKQKTIPLPTVKKGVRSTYKKPSKTPLADENKGSTATIETKESTKNTLNSDSFNTSYNKSIEQNNTITELRSRLLEKEKSALLSKIPSQSTTSTLPTNPKSSPVSSTISSATNTATSSTPASFRASSASTTSSHTSTTTTANPSFHERMQKLTNNTATKDTKSPNSLTNKLNIVNSHSLISSTSSNLSKTSSSSGLASSQTRSASILDRNKETQKSTPTFATSSPASTTKSSTSSSAKNSLNSDISDAEFIKLRDFLYEQSGIFVTETRKYLFKNRLLGRLNELELNSYDEYYNYLKTKDSSKKELNKFYEQMTTNETSFFRNVPQLNTVNEQVFKKYIELNRKEKKLNIFSAGCSSGEEPYTLAIMLQELLKAEKNQWKIKITAGDLSPAMLVAAHEGLYNEYSLRTTPKEYINKYFTQKSSLFEISPEIKKLVSFTQINLNDRAMVKKLVPQSDIVFCRNVIIYFDEEVKRNVVTGFYENLIPGGSLVIGHSETLNNISDKFEVNYLPNTQVYTKI